MSKEPIRVAEVMGKMLGGGVEAVVMNYYRHVDRSRVQFDFLVDSDSTLVPQDEIESLGGRVFNIPPYQHQLTYQRELVGLFREYRWSIVHSHVNTLSVFPLRAATKAGVPVRIAHSHSTSGRGEFVRNMVKNVLRTQANRYPTERFTCTEHAGRWLFGDHSFEVVPNPIDFPRFMFDSEARGHARSVWGVPEGTLAIGHVGRWAPQKNQIFLVHVLRTCLDEGMDVRLVLVGDGPGRPAIMAEAERLDVQDCLVAPGYMDSAEAYSGFDVLAFPSRYEGLGMVVMEAQAAGLSCVVSDALPREVDATGRCEFLPIEDPKAWMSAIARCDAIADRHVDLGAEQFRKHDADKIAAWLTVRYVELYEEASR